MRALKAVLPALLLLSLAAPAQAATFNVNTLGDGVDATPGDSVCHTGGAGNVCTVRAAVEESAALAGTDDIVLGPGTHSLLGRLDVIGHDVRIRGAGARATTIDQTQFGDGVALLADTSSEIRDLALTGGSSTLAGGGLAVGVAASRSVLVEGVRIADNEVIRSGGANSVGGGIIKGGSGLLTVRSSTITNNRALYFDSSIGGSAVGGGIAHDGGPLNLINVTIEDNEARATAPGASSFGGGVNSIAGATALSHVTLAGNQATGSSGRGGNLAANGSGHLNVENSIVAYGTASFWGEGCNVSGGGTLTSSGRNIETGSSCAFGAPHLSNTDPLLGALANNGGATDTMLPAPGSPAIDAAMGCISASEDQRGVSRPQGSACDIGAVEVTPAAGPPPEPPPADTVAPIVSDFVLSARRFRTTRATRRTRSLPRSTRLVFHLSEPSQVDFRFERRVMGRRSRSGACRRPSRRNRTGRRCVRWVAAGSLSDNRPEGTQSLRFNGNVTRAGRGRTLPAGSYRVRVNATDPAGNRSATVGGRFRIVR